MGNNASGAGLGWEATNAIDAYGLTISANLRNPNDGGRASIGASLYLLVKYADVQPSQFVCNSDKDVSKFMVSNYPSSTVTEDMKAWDFGPDPKIHYSYISGTNGGCLSCILFSPLCSCRF